jgi:hypothetical protein
MMYDHEKSDSAIVAVKPTNKAGQPAAELAEPRAGAGTKLTSPWPQRHPMLREKRTSNLRCLRSVFDPTETLTCQSPSNLDPSLGGGVWR